MEMRDSTICEMHESTIYESERLHFESMSHTSSELRVVVDKSSEAILISNNLRSTSSMFSHVAIGSMDDDTPILEKMYMVHTHDDTTPCDAAQHYVITMSTPKVTSFLFVNPIHPHMNGILPHAPYYDHARFT
jgi:hypothetical protein